jgi:hypothetical protein
MRSAVSNQAEIDRRIKEVARKLAPDVVRIRYAITSDSTGEEAIFLRILLSDEASRERRLRSVTERIESELLAAIPFDDFGLYQYFRYRNRSEHAMLKEPAW